MEKEDREKEKEEGNLGEISEIFICYEAEKKNKPSHLPDAA